VTKIVARRPWSPKVLLKLGRVSNLPTVWTNALAGTVISAGEVQGWRTAIVIIAMSSAYIGGMYLNDYFDRDVDSVERPSRPIPAGEISATTVGLVGFGMLGMAVVLLAWTGILSILVGALLAVVIVFYDRFHKNQPLAPAVMGLCRALVYCNAAAAAVGSVSTGVAAAARHACLCRWYHLCRSAGES
jgi:4-hydroxybenzoate polyprenyltransferase